MCLSLGAQGCPIRYLVQPSRKSSPVADVDCLSDKRQEGHLKGVLRIGRVAQDAAAGVEHHLPMPPDEQLEGRLVPSIRKPPQQLSVCDAAAPWRLGPPAKAPDQLV